jgi:DNA-binding ferritin-like protein
MYKTKNDLPETTRAKVIPILNTRLADSTEISRGVDKYLWFVEAHLG